MPNFIKVAEVSDIPPGTAKVVEVQNVEVALFNLEGQIYALDNMCQHAGGPLGEGKIKEDVVICPWHGYRYHIKTGQEFPSLGNAHIQRLEEAHVPYNSDPPTSGPHMPGIAPWGMYDQPIPKEFQVHNLEDGSVLVQYSCPKGCPDLVKKLETLFMKYKKR